MPELASFLIPVIATVANGLTIYMTYISATQKMQDGRYKTFWGRLKKGGKIFIVAGLLLIGIQWGQTALTKSLNDADLLKHDAMLYSNIKQVNDKSVLEIKKQADQTVSDFQHASNNNTQDIIKLLAENNLYYNKEQKSLQILIKDSSKRVEEATPTLTTLTDDLSTMEYENNIFLKVVLWSLNATSKEIVLQTSVLGIKDNRDFVYLQKSPIFMDNSECPKDMGISRKIIITDYKYPVIVLWIRGTYGDNTRKNKFSFDRCVYYNFDQKAMGEISGQSKENVIKISNAAETKH